MVQRLVARTAPSKSGVPVADIVFSNSDEAPGRTDSLQRNLHKRRCSPIAAILPLIRTGEQQRLRELC